VFGGICVVGTITGLAGGAEKLSDLVFGIGLFAVPTFFIVWAVAKLDPRSLEKITNHDQWRAQKERNKGIGALREQRNHADAERKNT
jgi:hypothetical protein